jgi:hypothetical protein
VLRTGAAKVSGSLMWVITTAGAGRDSIAYDIYSYAKRVQRGEVGDLGLVPLIWEAPRDCDWQGEALWHAVNPGLEPRTSTGCASWPGRPRSGCSAEVVLEAILASDARAAQRADGGAWRRPMEEDGGRGDAGRRPKRSS